MKIPHPTFIFEEKLWKQNAFVIGIDEVGKGCIAGPVVAGAVLFSPAFSAQHMPFEQKKLFATIHDSKLLSPQKRNLLSPFLKKICLSYGIGESSEEIINKEGITKATQKAMAKAISNCIKKYQTNVSYTLLIDGIQKLPTFFSFPQEPIVKGDQKSISIASASIIAKVYRDNLMTDLDKKYPGYGFAIHKGYGTKMHRLAIRQQGFSKIHRTSFNITHFSTLSF